MTAGQSTLPLSDTPARFLFRITGHATDSRHVIVVTVDAPSATKALRYAARTYGTDRLWVAKLIRVTT